MMVQCLHCKFWDRPDKWEEWVDIRTGGSYDWSDYTSTCFKLPDIDHVEVDLDIRGNAAVDVEISTCGTFGCVLGEPVEEEKTVRKFPNTCTCLGCGKGWLISEVGLVCPFCSGTLIRNTYDKSQQ